MKRVIIVSVLCASIGLALFARPVSAEAAGLTAAQVQAILSLLLSFGAAPALVQDVDDALNGRTFPYAAVPVSPITPVTVLSPESGASFFQGQPITISWSGGTEKVQIGLVDENYETGHAVLGWISLSEHPSGSLVWDGQKVSDITGTVSQAVLPVSKGPYRILGVSKNANNTFCVVQDSDCNYDVSDTSFSINYSAKPGTLSPICTPNAMRLQSGETATWEATTTGGVAPYLYSWLGSDGISALPRRSSEGRFLDVVYHAAGTKTAGVIVHDAKGQEGFVSCSAPLQVTPAPAFITDLMPSGGEYFALTKTPDPSQFMQVSWRSNGLPERGKEKLQIALVDEYGGECNVGSVSRGSFEAFVSLIEGYSCPESGFVLIPGKYKVKVYLEGKKTTVFDISDSYVTLYAPVDDPQSVTSSVSVSNSGDSVRFHFSAPSNTMKASLYVFCPDGITATALNTCNRYVNVLPYLTSSTDYVVTFMNTSSKAQEVAANFYVYRPNNPNYGRGVSAHVRVLPLSAVNTNSITVIAPNGGETVSYGVPYVYRFASSTTPGQVDLTLVPYPPIDASQVCQIGVSIPSSERQFSFTIPVSGACVRGPATKILGSYTLLATLRSGDLKLASDVSDSSFTIATTTTH